MSHSRKLRIVCISDTHSHRPGEGYTLPHGDVLIHAGDLSTQGGRHELQQAAEWLVRAEHAVKIVVAGNHDLALDESYTLKHREGWSVKPNEDEAEQSRNLMRNLPGVHYLEHAAIDIEVPYSPLRSDVHGDGDDDSSSSTTANRTVRLRVFGSPFSPARSLRQNWAFQYADAQAASLWSAIPSGIDILVSHTPPAGLCDSSVHWQEGGCATLREVLARVKPALHICGHCHEGRGAEVVHWTGESGAAAFEKVWTWDDPGRGTRKQSLLDLVGGRGGHALEIGRQTAVVNASVMAKSWSARGAKAFNKPVVVDIEVGRAEETAM